MGDGRLTFALVLRDGCGIYLSEDSEKHQRTRVWVGAEDIEPVYEEYKASGAKIRQAPTNYSWAYEMTVEDPDGHVLRIGSDLRKVFLSMTENTGVSRSV